MIVKGESMEPDTGRNVKSLLDQMLERQRKREHQLLATIESLQQKISYLGQELASAEADRVEARSETQRLRNRIALLTLNQKRLYEGYLALLSALESACGTGIAVDRRIEAALLSSETGTLLGDHRDITNERTRAFVSSISVNHGASE